MKAPMAVLSIWLQGYCCVRGSSSNGTDHSEHCLLNMRVRSMPSKMLRRAALRDDDIGQGEGCEGGKCLLPEKKP